MAKEIVGVRPYEFEDQRTHEKLSGFSVYLQWAEEGIQGIACESISASTAKLEGYVPQIGDNVRVGYNKYGKCDFMIKV